MESGIGYPIFKHTHRAQIELVSDLFALSLHAWRTNMAKFDQRVPTKWELDITWQWKTVCCPSRFSKSLGSEGDDRQTERTFQFHQETQFIWSVYCNHSIWRDRWFFLEILNLVMYGIHFSSLSKDVFPKAWVQTDPQNWGLSLPCSETQISKVHKYP